MFKIERKQWEKNDKDYRVSISHNPSSASTVKSMKQLNYWKETAFLFLLLFLHDDRCIWSYLNQQINNSPYKLQQPIEQKKKAHKKGEQIQQM